MGPRLLEFAPDCYESQEMSKKAVEKDICTLLQIIPGHLKTRETCEIAAEKYQRLLKYIPGSYKTKVGCKEAVQKILCLLESIHD